MTVAGQFRPATVQRRELDPNREFKHFTAALQVAKTEVNDFQLIADGISKGIETAQSIQQIRSTELDIRTKEANLEKTIQAQDEALKIKKQEQELLREITSGTEAEQLAAIDSIYSKYDPKAIENAMPAILNQIRKHANSDNPATRDVAQNDLLPRFDQKANELGMRHEFAMKQIEARGEESRKTKRVPSAGGSSSSQVNKNFQALLKSQAKRAADLSSDPLFFEALASGDPEKPDQFKSLQEQGRQKALAARGQPFEMLGQRFRTFDEYNDFLVRGFARFIPPDQVENFDPQMQGLIQRATQQGGVSSGQTAAPTDDIDLIPSDDPSIAGRQPQPQPTPQPQTPSGGAAPSSVPAPQPTPPGEVARSASEVQRNRQLAEETRIAVAKNTRATLDQYGIQLAPREFFGDTIPFGEGRIETTARQLTDKILSELLRKNPRAFAGKSPQEVRAALDRAREKLVASWSNAIREMVNLGE